MEGLGFAAVANTTAKDCYQRVPAFTMRAMGLCAWAIAPGSRVPYVIWRRLLAYRGWALLQPSANFEPMPVSPSFLRPRAQGLGVVITLFESGHDLLLRCFGVTLRREHG